MIYLQPRMSDLSHFRTGSGHISPSDLPRDDCDVKIDWAVRDRTQSIFDVATTPSHIRMCLHSVQIQSPAPHRTHSLRGSTGSGQATRLPGCGADAMRDMYLQRTLGSKRLGLSNISVIRNQL